MNNWKLIMICILAVFAITACNNTAKPTEPKAVTKYTTYTGQLSVVADNGLQSIIKQQEEIFDFVYDSVETTLTYETEKQMFADFRTKKATVMLLSRKLAQSEINDFKNIDTIYIREQPVAYDAVALVAGKNFDDSKLDMALLKSYFAPNATSNTTPKLVFENRESSTVRFVVETLGYKEKVSPNVFALKSVQEVLDYVAANPNIIGFIPYNTISDQDDERVKKMLENVKILSLRTQTKDGNTLRVSANQSDIAAGDYPLIRTINAVTRFTYVDNLELLFIGFLGKEKGAKIFLKAGLMPVKSPERDIIVNESEVRGSK